MIWLETIANGILLGGLYALIGLGLGFAFGVMRVVNVAQGDFIVAAAFIGLYLYPWTPLLSIAACLYLMWSLPQDTWLRLALWLVAGGAVYCLYGLRRRRKARGS